jgi:amino acid adenylation domain-containing protein
MDVNANTPVAAWFRHVVASNPEALALTTADARYTYADIDRWSDAIASDLAAAHAPVDRPVAIVTKDNITLVAAAMAVVKAGHFFVMIDAADPDERIALILHESGAGCCLVDSLANAPASARALPMVAMRKFADARDAHFEDRTPHESMYAIFTSGTTGKPKAVLTPQRRYVEKSLAQRKRWGRAPGENCTYTALPGFTRASNSIFGTLLAGATMCAFDARSESLDALAEYITRERITLLSLTPSLFRRLTVAAPPGLDLSSVKKLRIGADRVTIADVAAFKQFFPRGCTLELGFASTESGSVFQFSVDHDTPVPGPLVPMGRPAANVEVWLLDEDGHEVPNNVAGEIVVRSEHVCDGYWKSPVLTAQRFVFYPDQPDVKKFFTGDLAKRDDDGLYYFVGRRDARLKIHGRRIDPSEVEAAMLATGEIRDAVVVGKPDAHGEMRLVAYVVMQNGSTATPRTIRATLREHAPSWMVPARIHVLDKLPMTRAAKADRAALIALVDEHDHAEDSGASDELQRRLVEIWTKVIGTSVSIHDDFFDDLGGESVVAAHLVTEVHRETGRSIPLSLLIELNTVAKMADYLRGGEKADPIAVQLQKGDPSLPPLFCVSGAGGSVMVFRRLARSLGSDQPFYGLHHHAFKGDTPPSYIAIATHYIETIRRIQPEGPYFICGYSSGGKLAFEVARQLEHAHEKVAFVGLIDTGVGGKSTTAKQRLRNRIAFLRQRPFVRAPKYLWEMAVLRPLFHLKLFLGMRQRLGDFMPDESVMPEELREQNRAFSKARAGFTLQPYGGPVTLFRARHGLGALHPEPDLGWRDVGVGRLDIFEVDGDHRSVLEEDVASLGGAFRTALASAR